MPEDERAGCVPIAHIHRPQKESGIFSLFRRGDDGVLDDYVSLIEHSLQKDGYLRTQFGGEELQEYAREQAWRKVEWLLSKHGLVAGYDGASGIIGTENDSLDDAYERYGRFCDEFDAQLSRLTGYRFSSEPLRPSFADGSL